MARVLFVNGGLEGHVGPTLRVVEELIARGEQVTYVATEAFRGRLEALGAEVIEFDGERFSEAMRAGRIDNFLGVATGILRTADVVVPRVLEQLEHRPVDYVIHDSMLGSGRIIAHMLGRPAVCSCSTFARTEAVIEAQLEKLAGMLPFDAYRQAREEFTETAGQVEQTYGVPMRTVYQAYCNPAPLTLVYTSRLFQPGAENCDPSVKFVGPTFDRDRADAVDFPDLTGLPVIYISFGTVFNQAADFYRLCFEAFAQTPYAVVLSVGRHIDIADLGAIPPNFIVRNHVPQLAVLKQTRLFVTHGGMNSVNEGLFFGVPLIVFPQGADQHQVAQRVVDLGVGVRLSQAGLTAETLRSEVARLLEDETVKAACLSVGASLRLPGGAPQAAEEVMTWTRSWGAGENS